MSPFAHMNTELREEFINGMGKLVAPMMPEDGLFFIVCIDDKGNAMQVGTIPPKDVPRVLRELAIRLEAKERKSKRKKGKK